MSNQTFEATAREYIKSVNMVGEKDYGLLSDKDKTAIMLFAKQLDKAHALHLKETILVSGITCPKCNSVIDFELKRYK